MPEFKKFEDCVRKLEEEHVSVFWKKDMHASAETHPVYLQTPSSFILSARVEHLAISS